MEKTIPVVNKQLLDYMGVLEFEIQAYSSLVAYMISNDMNISTDSFSRYENEYKANLLKLKELVTQFKMNTFLTWCVCKKAV